MHVGRQPELTRQSLTLSRQCSHALYAILFMRTPLPCLRNKAALTRPCITIHIHSIQLVASSQAVVGVVAM